MAIPHFTRPEGLDEDVLPPGVHTATVPEIKALLVDAFPESVTRLRLFTHWLMFRSWMSSLVGVEVREYIDGSFVTGRVNPADIDISLEVHADVINGMEPENRQILSYLANTDEGRAVAKRLYSCHPFLTIVAEPDHPDHSSFLATRWPRNWWKKYTNPDKIRIDGIEKGYVEVTGPT